MRFEQLLEASGVEVLACRGQARVDGVAVDSRRAAPGTCFIAIPGTGADGHDFIASAVTAGASCVVCEDPARVPPGVAWARLADTACAAGPLGQAFHGWPARRLCLVGATGTKGKTTFTYLVRQILQHAAHATGLIGTIRYEYPGRAVPAPNTTPGAVDLAAMMAEMVGAGVTHLAMEVSSHALDQHRTAALAFATAAFTNLSGDHLDYHGTMERYLDAKSLLFEQLDPAAWAVLNRHDPAAATLARRTCANVLWYGIDEDEPAAAGETLEAHMHRLDAGGAEFELTWRGRRATVASGLMGRHNVLNCLAAAGACLPLGVPLESVAAALSQPLRVPGRLERVPSAAPFEVLVDYAHTDDALDNALQALRPLTRGRLIVLFGCGGDRDRTKRPRMARVAQERADRIILTSDNPRTEDPLRILNDVMAGFTRQGRDKLAVEPDRRAAIALAIGQARPGDVVLLAGKGHEDYQIVGTVKSPFDDRLEALAALEQRFGAPREARA